MENRLFAAVAVAAVFGAGVAAAEDSRDALIRELTASLEIKEKQIEKLKSEVERLKAEVARLKDKLGIAEGQPAGGAGKTEPARPIPPVAPAVKPISPAERPVARSVSPVEKPAKAKTIAPDTRPAARPAPAVPPETALQQKLAQIKFDGQTFEQVLESFQENHGVQLWVKWNQLAVAGIQRKAPVRLAMSNITVGKALQLVLDEVSTSGRIEYGVEDGLVVISQAEDLAGGIEVLTYDVKDLLSGPGGRAQNSAKLIRTITGTIDPPSWKPPNIGLIREIGGRLFVTANARNQRAIADLLKTLRDQEQR